MRRKTETTKQPAEKVVRDIRRRTRKHHSVEEKIRIVLEGLRGEESIAELCRREGIATSLYCSWSKEFLEAGKRRLSGDTAQRRGAEGEGAAGRGVGSEGGRRGPHPREPAAEKSMLGDGGDDA